MGGGGQFLDFMGRHSFYEEDIGLMGVSLLGITLEVTPVNHINLKTDWADYRERC